MSQQLGILQPSAFSLRKIVVGIIVSASTAFNTLAVHAATPDEWVLQARDAFRVADTQGFEKAASQIPADHAMYAYLEFWRYKLKQPDSKSTEGIEKEAELEYLLSKYAGTWPAEQFRRDFLLALAKRADWPKFNAQAAQLLQKDDLGTQCLETFRDDAAGKDVLAVSQGYLQHIKELPEGCILLGERLYQAGKLTHKDIMQRVLVLVENGSNPHATRVYSYLHNNGGKEKGTDLKALEIALEKPGKYLKDLPAKTSQGKLELAVVAISRLSRSEPEESADWLEKLAPRLDADHQSWSWAQIGLFSSRKWHVNASKWFGNGQPEQRSKEAHEWFVRSHLMNKNWGEVKKAIEAMPASVQSDSAWRYWLAKAMQNTGNTAGARSIYTSLISPFSFYGQLATEEVGQSVKLPPLPAQAITVAELTQAQQNPGFQRAAIWYRLGQRTEGFREFNFTLTGMTDRQLLASAVWAQQNDLPDRAIAAADRTTSLHDVRLRYLTPFKESLQNNANLAGLELAWVYGLIRQESRFIQAAKSVVGASGLMQLMPATAKMVAKKIGMEGYDASKVNDLDTNLRLGTTYLKMLSDQLDSSLVMATAGYNAGPGRPRNWRTKMSFPSLEGEIFAEVIPFTETRDYVKKVSSNTVAYANLLEGKPQSLKQRLGSVVMQSASTLTVENEIIQQTPN
jgi:soluble lytic murein transglycosylase